MGKPIEQVHEIRRIIVALPERTSITAQGYVHLDVEPVAIWDMDQGK